jgi:hypothetical protein
LPERSEFARALQRNSAAIGIRRANRACFFTFSLHPGAAIRRDLYSSSGKLTADFGSGGSPDFFAGPDLTGINTQDTGSAQHRIQHFRRGNR